MATLRVPLRSSFLVSAEWDDETRTLEVTTTKGRTYSHPNVPQGVFEGLRDASSPGRYWHSRIKDSYG